MIIEALSVHGAVLGFGHSVGADASVRPPEMPIFLLFLVNLQHL